MQQAPWLAAARYEVGEVVGRGGYGMVCRGIDRQTGRAVALKMLSPEAGRDADVVERMLREQQALVALSGTCAVTAIDLCRLESGAPCLIMEWLDGCDLEARLTAWETAGIRGSFEELLGYLKPLTQTLERAHDLGIVHRDIKPANVFLTNDGGVRLLDFGLSRMKSAAPLTAVGMVMGSPSYIAPETWRGNSRLLDGRADLFGLAVIVFRWLTGQLPFDTPDLIAKMTAVTSGPRPSARALRPELPESVDAWVSRALAIEPSDRFHTGGDFYRALEAALRGEPWPVADAESSGVRSVPEAAERKNALAAAWQAAASLLKHFTGPRKLPSDAPPPAPPAAPPAPVATPTPAVVEDQRGVWLDSGELEELAEPSTLAEAVAPATADAPAPTAQDPSRPTKRSAKKNAKREAKAAKKGDAKKGKGKGKAKRRKRKR
jgi:eukaryotic-like serine/threonine-protein kinase